MIDYILVSLNDLLELISDENIILNVFKKFACKREVELADFLKTKAIEYEKQGFGKTFVFFDKQKFENDELEVMAYYTIGINSIDISNISGKQKRRMLGTYPGRDNKNSISTFLIGQIGRSDAYQSEDISGDILLEECYHSISTAAKIVGGSLVFLECREHMFEKFYERKQYKKLQPELNENNLYSLYRKIDFSEYWKKDNNR